MQLVVDGRHTKTRYRDTYSHRPRIDTKRRRDTGTMGVGGHTFVIFPNTVLCESVYVPKP